MRFRHSLPSALILRGRAIRSPSWAPWIRYLCQLPSAVPILLHPLHCDSWNDVFVDGSCFCQSEVDFRFAAWSAILVPPCASNWTSGRSVILQASVLLHWAAVSSVRVRIWSDCLGVINKYLLLTRGNVKLKPNEPNFDLWNWILESVRCLGQHRVQLFKVKAHLQVRAATSRFDAWKRWCNGVADRAAKIANLVRGESFWKMWSGHVRDIVASRTLFQQVSHLRLAVAKLSTHSSTDLDAVTTAPAVRETRVFQKFFTQGNWDGSVPAPFAERYGMSHAQGLVGWWSSRAAMMLDQPLVWVSFAQLRIDFQMSCAHVGPSRIGREWVDVRHRPYVEAEQFPFKVRVRWFRRYLQWFWTHTGVQVALEQCRVIQGYVPCVSLPWNGWILTEVDRWLGVTLKGPCVRNTGVLNSLPIAAPNAALAVSSGPANPVRPF